MNTATLPAFVPIPAIGTVPAYAVDPLNRAHVRALIERADAYFDLSRLAWMDSNENGHSDAFYVACQQREQRNADNGAALLAPFGISTDWPGLYPSFTVKGRSEHTTKAALLAALDHPANWLTPDKDFTFTFHGRRKGAIGIFSDWEVTVSAVDEKAAALKLYDTHEHIRLKGKPTVKEL